MFVVAAEAFFFHSWISFSQSSDFDFHSSRVEREQRKNEIPKENINQMK